MCCLSVGWCRILISQAPFALSAGGLSAGMRDVTGADEMLCDLSISIHIHPDPSIKELPDPENFPPLADGLTKYSSSSVFFYI